MKQRIVPLLVCAFPLNCTFSEDVTVASLFDILRAMGLTVRLESLGMPTLDEMRQRFSADTDGEEGDGA